MTRDDLRQREAERQAELAELAAIDRELDTIQRRFGAHELIEDARARTYALRVTLLAQAGPTIH